MEKILIGMIGDGKSGGIDAYILRFFDAVKNTQVKIDFLTNIPDNPLQNNPLFQDSVFYYVSGLKNPKKQYDEIKQILFGNLYDIVYMNVSTAITYPALKAAHDSKVRRIIVHSHSSGFDCSNAYKRKLFTILHKLCKHKLCRYATEFFTCSDKAAEWMFTRSVNSSREIVHIQNSADISKFSFDAGKRDSIRRKLGLTGEFVIGTVGNMVYQKNQLFLIDVFSELHKRDKDAVLVIIGDGPLKDNIIRKINLLNLENKVLLLGRVNASDGYMSAFDVFALPSVFEGMPTVSVEAQMSLLPCVLSDSITREAKITNACVFVPNNNTGLWVDALLKCKDAEKESVKFDKDIRCFSTQDYAEYLRKIIWG